MCNQKKLKLCAFNQKGLMFNTMCLGLGFYDCIFKLCYISAYVCECAWVRAACNHVQHIELHLFV